MSTQLLLPRFTFCLDGVLVALVIAAVCVDKTFIFQPSQNIEDEILAAVVGLVVEDRCIVCGIFDSMDLRLVDLAQVTELDNRLRSSRVRWRSHFKEVVMTNTEDVDDGLAGVIAGLDEQAPVLDAWVVVDGNLEGDGRSHVDRIVGEEGMGLCF